MEKWINEIGVSIHRMEYHAALKSKVILMYAATQMNLEDTKLSEISQTKKDKYWVPRGVKLRDRK